MKREMRNIRSLLGVQCSCHIWVAKNVVFPLGELFYILPHRLRPLGVSPFCLFVICAKRCPMYGREIQSMSQI